MKDKPNYELITCLCLFALIGLLIPNTKYKKPELPSHCMNISGKSAHIGEIALNQGIEYDIPNGCIVKGEVPETITDIEELEYYVQEMNANKKLQ